MSGLVIGLIGVISGLITIALGLVAVYGWVRSHAFIIRVHNPQQAVSGDALTILDVSRAMERLAEDARAFGPDHIVGINRGGTIVGGWLAKKIDLEIPTIYVVNSDEPPGKRVIPQVSRTAADLSGKIYLVDDAQRKGEHMREARNYLMARYPNAQVRRAVLLQMSVPHAGPEAVAFRSTPCEFTGFFTSDAAVVLPWDKD